MHLGALEAACALGITPQAISGTSFGALAGAWYASGHPPKDLLELLLASSVIKTLRFKPSKLGLADIEATFAFLEQYLKPRFETLAVPLLVSASDLLTGQSVVFEKGDLLRPVAASCALPFLFRPVAVGPYLLCDGGVLNNMPVEPLENRNLQIVGFHSNPPGTRKQIGHGLQLGERVFNLAIYQNAKQRVESCHWVIEPPEMARYRVSDFAKAREIYQLGYQYGIRVFEALLKQP
jgi:NTE family protein